MNQRQKNNLITEGFKDINTKEELKDFILTALIQNSEEVKNEVQELFKL